MYTIKNNIIKDFIFLIKKQQKFNVFKNSAASLTLTLTIASKGPRLHV